MALKSRLARLRREAGGPGAPASPEPASALGARLGRMRPRAAAPGRERRLDEPALAARLGAERLAPGLLLIERRLPLAASHGRWPLRRLQQPLQALPEARRLSPGALVFLDTETSGLSGGTGTHVFLLGLGRIEGPELVLRQYLLTAFAGERMMLEAGAEWLGEAVLVSYNGKSFDLPLLSARCRLAGAADAYSGRGHLDLLHPVRRAYGARWEDCRLASVEQRLLGVRREDDLPGAQAPQAWFDLLHRGDAGLLPAVLEHNRRDLVSLGALYCALDAVYAAPQAHEADVAAVARAHLRHGDDRRALELLWAARASLAQAPLMELARLLRRAGRLTEARRLWERLAAQGHPPALEALAKYHEHVDRDPAAALRYARALPAGPAHERRRNRLAAKLAHPTLF